MADNVTGFIPTIAQPQAAATFLEILSVLGPEWGLIDFVPDANQGGQYLHIPKFGKLSGGFGRVDVFGTLTSSQTTKSMLFKDHIGVVRYKSLLQEYHGVTPPVSGLTSEQFSMEIGRQIGIEAAKTLIDDLYNAAIASADSVADDHDHEPYVDTGVASNQVDLIATVLQAGKFLLGDLMNDLDVGVTRSKSWNDMTLSSISSTFNVPNIMGDVYREGQFGRILGTNFIVDDRVPTAAGPTTNSPTKQQTLLFRSRFRHPEGLSPFVVSFQRPLEIFEQHVLGQQSIKFQRQPEIAYSVGVRGKAWDITNGGANPTDANFALSTNWDDAYDDHKEVGIILIRTN